MLNCSARIFRKSLRMNKRPKARKPQSEEDARFEKLAKALIAVPQSVIDGRQSTKRRRHKEARM
jgi:hypothetical protein